MLRSNANPLKKTLMLAKIEAKRMLVIRIIIKVFSEELFSVGNEGRGPMEAETRAGTWCGARERLAAHTNPCSLLPRCWPRFRT